MIKTLFPKLYYTTHFNKSSVGQLFIISEEVDTFFCFNNHQGFLFPQDSPSWDIKLDIHNAKGKKILTHHHTLTQHESLNISIRTLLKGKVQLDHAELLGTIVCTTPGTTMRNHFYTYYRDDQTESVAMIHPQSVVGRKATDKAWISNQLIATAGLDRIVLYQMNHSRSNRDCTYFLTAPGSAVPFATRTLSVASLGAAKVEFDLTDAPKLLSVSLDRLVSPNGKPLIMRRYQNHKFTINHG